MFNQKINIIAITRYKILVAQVQSRKQEITKLAEFELKSDQLESIFSQVKKLVKNTSCRLLLNDKLAYVLNLDMDNEQEITRLQVESKIKSLIPENLTNHKWDYRLIKGNKQKSQVLVFAPVQKFFQAIVEAILNAEIVIEAVEPTSVAQKRHKNPFLGLALKRDISGPDEKVLNLLIDDRWQQPQTQKEKDNHQVAKSNRNPTQEEDQTNNNKKSSLWLLLFLVMVGAGVGVYFDNQSQQPRLPKYLPAVFQLPFYKQSETEIILDTVVEPDSAVDLEPTQIATPSAETINLSDYQVQVLNGSGQSGVAGEVAELLQAQGFENIKTGNADNFDYQQV